MIININDINKLIKVINRYISKYNMEVYRQNNILTFKSKYLNNIEINDDFLNFLNIKFKKYNLILYKYKKCYILRSV